MGAPGFYESAREQIAAVEQRLAQIESALAAAYARWEALEALR